MADGPGYYELYGDNDNNSPSYQGCPRRYYSLARLILSPAGTVTSRIDLNSPPANSNNVFYIARVRPADVDGNYIPQVHLNQMQLVSPSFRSLLRAVKSGCSGSVQSVLDKLYLKSQTILYGSIELIFCEAPRGFALFSERVIQFFSSRFEAFDEYARMDWNYALQLIKDIHQQYKHDNRFDGSGRNRMFSCVLDARQAGTTLNINQGTGESYLYSYTIGIPENELQAIRAIDHHFSSLLGALFYGVSSTHFRGPNRDNPSLTRIRTHRASMPVSWINASFIFGMDMSLLEAKIKTELEVHHCYGPQRRPLRESLNTFSGLTRHRFEEFCQEYVDINPCFRFPTNHSFHGKQQFVHARIEREKGQARFPSTMILLIQLLRLPNPHDCHRKIAEVMDHYGSELSIFNRLATPGDVVLFRNQSFLNAPVHVQAQYISIDLRDGDPNGIFSVCKSMLEQQLGLGLAFLPIPGSPSTLPINSIELQSLDTQTNRIRLGHYFEEDGEVFVEMDGDLTKQELLLLHFLDRFEL